MYVDMAVLNTFISINVYGADQTECLQFKGKALKLYSHARIPAHNTQE